MGISRQFSDYRGPTKPPMTLWRTGHTTVRSQGTTAIQLERDDAALRGHLRETHRLVIRASYTREQTRHKAAQELVVFAGGFERNRRKSAWFVRAPST